MTIDKISGTDKTFGRTSDFSAIASRYDETRCVPRDRLLACYDRLIARGLFAAGGTVVDAGCGTGQMSLPLADRGYTIRGFDVSPEMIALAMEKRSPSVDASYVVADVRRLAQDDHSADTVVFSKLLMHVEDWKHACRELARIVRPNGSIVEIRDRGAFGNAVRRYFSEAASQAGFGRRFIGLAPGDKAELIEFMQSLGRRVVSIDMRDLNWPLAIRYGDILAQFEERLFAEFWYLPEKDYAALLDETRNWVSGQPQGEDTVEYLQPYLSVDAFVSASEAAREASARRD